MNVWVKCLNRLVCAYLQVYVYNQHKTATFYISYVKFFLWWRQTKRTFWLCILQIWICLYIFHSLLLYSDFSLQLSNSIYAFKKVSIEVFAPLLTSSNKNWSLVSSISGNSFIHLLLSHVKSGSTRGRIEKKNLWCSILLSTFPQ